MPPPAEPESELWLVVREEVKPTPHIRAFADFLPAHIQAQRAQLAGE